METCQTFSGLKGLPGEWEKGGKKQHLENLPKTAKLGPGGRPAQMRDDGASLDKKRRLEKIWGFPEVRRLTYIGWSLLWFGL